MKKYFLISVTLVFGLFYSLAQEYNWESVQFSELNDDFDVINKIAISTSNEKILIGFYQSEAIIGGEGLLSTNQKAVFLAKFSENDELIWAKTIAEIEILENGSSSLLLTNPLLEIDDNGVIYVGLTYQGSLYVNDNSYIANEFYDYYEATSILKFDLEGNQIDHIRFDGSCNKTIASGNMKIDSSQNIYFLAHYGNSDSNTSVPCNCIINDQELFTDDFSTSVIKFNSLGETVWIKTFETNITHIDIINDELYVAGIEHYAFNVDFGDYTLYMPSTYDHAAYIAKFTTDGDFIWAKHIGNKGWDSHIYLFDMKVVNEENIVLIGQSYAQSVDNILSFQGTTDIIATSGGSTDFFVVSYNNNGAVNWRDVSHNLSDEYTHSLIFDNQANVYIAGTFTGTQNFAGEDHTSSGSHDIMILCYDENGNQQWLKQAGGVASDQANDIVIDSNENLYVTGGTISHPTIFGVEEYNLEATTSMFLAKMVDQPIGITENDTPSLHIFPNPVSGKLQVQTNQQFHKLELIDVLGQKVISQNVSSQDVSLNLSVYKDGVYFLQLSLENGRHHTEKIIVTHNK